MELAIGIFHYDVVGVATVVLAAVELDNHTLSIGVRGTETGNAMVLLFRPTGCAVAALCVALYAIACQKIHCAENG